MKASGHLYAESDSFYTSSTGVYWTSDRRYKKDIKSIPDDFVEFVFDKDTDLLKTFKWKETGLDSVGFIAQELVDRIPEAVDYDTKKDKYSVNYDVALSKVLGAAVKKIKTQDEEIKLLRKELDELKSLIREKLA